VEIIKALPVHMKEDNTAEHIVEENNRRILNND